MTDGVEFRHLRYEREPRAVRVTIDHPPVNVLDLAVIDELRRALDAAASDDVPALVLRGAGGRAFSAGVDVAAHTPDQVGTMLEGFHAVIRALWGLDLVSIAVVEGAALGGGCELAASCDLVLASEGSVFGQPEIKLACFPPVAAAVLPRRIGHHRACEVLYLGDNVSARRAAEYGLVNWVVPAAELDAKLDEVLDALAGLSRAALRITRRAILASGREEWRQALERTEDLYLGQLARTEDMAEGVAAFLEKRPPRWRHR